MFNRRLFSETRSRRGFLAASLLFNVLSAVLVVSQAYLTARVIDAIFLGGLTLDQVWPLTLWLAVAIGLRALFAGAGDTSARLIGIRIKEDLRNRLLAHLMDLGPAAIQGERSGELTNTAVEGIESLQGYFSEYLPAITQAAVLPLIVLIAVFPLDPLSAIVLLATAPLIPIFMLLIGRLAKAQTQRQWKILGRLSAHFLDVLQGLTTLKLFGSSRGQAAEIRMVSTEYANATLGVLRIAFLSALALEMLATLSTAIVAVEIGLRLLSSAILFEQALFILILAPEFYTPLRNLGARFHSGMAGVAAAARVFEILDQLKPIRGSKKLNREFKQIAFNQVSYQYSSADFPILSNVNFNLKPSTLNVLVGPTGAGKTTLMNMLLGFLNPTTGAISINGTNLDEIDLETWRALLAWVPQKPYLFHETIAANLRLARPEADDASLWRALENAQLAETVRAFPKQLDTVIAERGIRLSGGQAQRLALARAYLKDAPLLLLDEPTAHLDSHTETAVTAALETWRAGRIVLAIAHRQHTIEMADQVLLVQRGLVTARPQPLRRVAATQSHGAISKAGAP